MSGVVDKKKLLQQTRRMNQKLERQRQRREQDHAAQIQEIERLIAKKTEEIVRLRNDKHSEEFRNAKADRDHLQQELAVLKKQLSVSSSYDAIDNLLSASKLRQTLDSTSASKSLNRSLREVKHKQNSKTGGHVKHSVPFDNSTSQNIDLISRPVVALGPSQPSLLRMEWTKFDHKPKVPWRAVPEGLTFGEPPSLKGSASPSSDHPPTASLDGSRSRRSRRKHQQHQQEAGGVVNSMPDPWRYPHKEPWKPAKQNAGVFSKPAYDRPPTDHEAALAKRTLMADRALYKPEREGKEPWRDTDVDAGMFSHVKSLASTETEVLQAKDEALMAMLNEDYDEEYDGEEAL